MKEGDKEKKEGKYKGEEGRGRHCLSNPTTALRACVDRTIWCSRYTASLSIYSFLSFLFPLPNPYPLIPFLSSPFSSFIFFALLHLKHYLFIVLIIDLHSHSPLFINLYYFYFVFHQCAQFHCNRIFSILLNLKKYFL